MPRQSARDGDVIEGRSARTGDFRVAREYHCSIMGMKAPLFTQAAATAMAFLVSRDGARDCHIAETGCAAAAEGGNPREHHGSICYD